MQTDCWAKPFQGNISDRNFEFRLKFPYLCHSSAMPQHCNKTAGNRTLQAISFWVYQFGFWFVYCLWFLQYKIEHYAISSYNLLIRENIYIFLVCASSERIERFHSAMCCFLRNSPSCPLPKNCSVLIQDFNRKTSKMFHTTPEDHRKIPAAIVLHPYKSPELTQLIMLAVECTCTWTTAICDQNKERNPTHIFIVVFNYLLHSHT